MKYFIIAGEASGDMHGASLISGILESDAQASVRFVGGERMSAALASGGVSSDGMVADYRDGAVMGFSEVLCAVPSVLRRFRKLREEILSWRPDVVILIDYPWFNLKMARFARRHGFKVFWYIAPKVWASREGRLKAMAAYIDRLYVIFPFEVDYFRSKGMECHYFGNPLIDAAGAHLAGDAAGLAPEEVRIALLPGSRKAEIRSMMPVYMGFADRARSEGKPWKFVIAAPGDADLSDYTDWVSGREDYVSVVKGDTASVLRLSRAAVVNSGTASLEAAVAGVPEVVCYRTSMLTYLIGKRIIKVPYICLCNLILGKMAVKELIQNEFNIESVYGEICELVQDGERRERMAEDFRHIRSLLGGGGAASAAARDMVQSLKG